MLPVNELEAIMWFCGTLAFIAGVMLLVGVLVGFAESVG